MINLEDLRIALQQLKNETGKYEDILYEDVAVPSGPVDLNGQQMINMRIENRTSDPTDPDIGQIWLRTDL